MTSDVDRRQPRDRTADTAAVTQGIVVAVLSLAPLTVAGHYSANLLRGNNTNPVTALSVLWLGLFYAIGLLMALTALAAISRSTRHLALRPVILLSLALAASTFDWWTLLGTPTAPVLNLAAASVVVFALGEVARHRRGGTIPRSIGSRVLDWAAGTLLSAAPLVFVLPHPATVGGVTEDCSPVWVVVEARCLGASDAWWPLGVGLGLIGAVLWALGHGVSPVPSGTRRRGPGPFRRRRPRGDGEASPRPGPPRERSGLIDLTSPDPVAGRPDPAPAPRTAEPAGGRRLGELQAVPPPRPRARSRPRTRPEDQNP